MSGHHPPSWNHHHPMQVPPPYILPMAHMSNERQISGAWHNSTGVPPGPSGHALNQEHNQYPYVGPSNRKHSIDMNPMMAPSQYTGRHPMVPNGGDYDSPMMDLTMARNNNNQLNNASPREQQQHQQLQDYSHKLSHSKDICDGPILGVPAANGDGFPNDIDLLNRRQNPVGLPPMAEAMELVKEALLSKMKSQVPSISDLGAAFNQEQLPESLVHKPLAEAEESGGGGVNLSVDARQHEVDSYSTTAGVKESRRKTRKPNKTSKVVNEGGQQGRSSTEGEENGSASVPADSEEGHDMVVAAVAPQRQQAPESSDVEDDAEVAKKRKRIQRSSETSTVAAAAHCEDGARTEPPDTLQTKTNGAGESHNGEAGKEQQQGEEGEDTERQPGADPDTSFEEVENKLTEMFAGIADAEDVSGRAATDAPLPAKKAGRRKSVCLSMLIGDEDIETDDDEDFSVEVPKKAAAAAKGKRKRPANKGGTKLNISNNGAAAAPASSTPVAVKNKKKSGKVGGVAKKKKKGSGNKWDDEVLPPTSSASSLKKPPKDMDEGRYRGPLLQVRQDGSLCVLNGPQGQAEDDQDTRNGVKVKKFLHNGAERNKVIRGLHTNTLSMKYDTDRTDTTWVCVFCKLGPHKMGLGDLFGPYMATTDCDEYRLMEAQAGDVFKSNRTRMDMVQSAPHRLPAVPASGCQVALKSPNSKLPVPGKRGPKKKQPQQLDRPSAEVSAGSSSALVSPAEDLYLGLTRATDTSYEIWIHEDCIVWGSGIHMVAGRLVGVEDAVWGSTSSRCNLCRKPGAVICCLQRGCSERVHLPCGRQSNWTLDEELLNSYCQTHGAALCPGAVTMSNR